MKFSITFYGQVEVLFLNNDYIIGRSEINQFNQLFLAGVIVPLGGLVANKLPPSRYGTNDSEYIIHDEDQCALRYIIQFRTVRN